MWIAELWISARVAEKIRSVHAIEPEEVRDAVVCREDIEYKWVSDARGQRVYVRVCIRGADTLVVVYPVVNHPMGDVYQLGSAYHL